MKGLGVEIGDKVGQVLVFSRKDGDVLVGVMAFVDGFLNGKEHLSLQTLVMVAEKCVYKSAFAFGTLFKMGVE